MGALIEVQKGSPTNVAQLVSGKAGEWKPETNVKLKLLDLHQVMKI